MKKTAKGEPKLRTEPRWGLPFGALFARRASPCSPLPPSLGAASAVLASTGAVFVYWSTYPQASIRTYTYIPIWVYLYKKHSGQASRPLSQRDQGRWFESRVAALFCVCAIFTFIWWRHVFYYQHKNIYDDDWGVVWAIEKSVLHAYSVLLFLATGVHHRVPDDQICCWFIELWSRCSLSLHSTAIYF